MDNIPSKEAAQEICVLAQELGKVGMAVGFDAVEFLLEHVDDGI